MNKKESYIIRQATQEEVESIAVEWAAKEGWNPGFYDTPCFYLTDPKGFFVGLLDEEPVSCISAVAYDQHFAFLGFYIVKPEYRGKGYGLKLWNTAMAYLQSRNIGLDGVVEQQANYKKSGFKFAYSNIRYEGAAISTAERFPELVPLSEVPFDEIVKYDAALFPASRSQFLHRWVKQPGSLALAALRDGKVKGYGVIRKCRAGYKIGPLFADAADLSHKLFLALGNGIASGSKIYLDIPEVNHAAIQLAENRGMKKVFGTARMYTKYQPDIDLNKVFGVTTFELG
ncbi:GNAT family N-acetyltransferase [Proteiniphilum sp.]|uniref:GNAT family N-acetyltransferase n=1 Tax=Proteiniphilum sp. TaxID=1926877 RepID=UPI002B211ADB|nr:GNAT family N-acetyltransferase [Proteiniphilum sp.]MEA4917504.1 GNAT family N-acetyltransferase [Proteiniphilum sp.]